jgi:outer membrane murein-binding lipoprotein Lpp
MPEIQWKIDLGHILTIFAMVVSAIFLTGQIMAKLDEYSRQLQEVHNKVDTIQLEQERVRTVLELREKQQQHR